MSHERFVRPVVAELQVKHSRAPRREHRRARIFEVAPGYTFGVVFRRPIGDGDMDRRRAMAADTISH